MASKFKNDGPHGDGASPGFVLLSSSILSLPPYILVFLLRPYLFRSAGRSSSVVFLETPLTVSLLKSDSLFCVHCCSLSFLFACCFLVVFLMGTCDISTGVYILLIAGDYTVSSSLY